MSRRLAASILPEHTFLRLCLTRIRLCICRQVLPLAGNTRCCRSLRAQAGTPIRQSLFSVLRRVTKCHGRTSRLLFRRWLRPWRSRPQTRLLRVTRTGVLPFRLFQGRAGPRLRSRRRRICRFQTRSKALFPGRPACRWLLSPVAWSVRWPPMPPSQARK